MTTESRRVDRQPETEADRRLFDLRESGYPGWIDQDGYPALDPAPEFPPDDDGRRYILAGPRGLSPFLDALNPGADHHEVLVYGSADLARRVTDADRSGVCVAWRQVDNADDDTDGA
jgi:hypothetical protein